MSLIVYFNATNLVCSTRLTIAGHRKTFTLQFEHELNGPEYPKRQKLKQRTVFKTAHKRSQFISLHANDSYTIGLCLSAQKMIARNSAWHSEPFTLFRIFRHFNRLRAERRVYPSYNKFSTSLAGLNPV